jgi:hypothetical protein
MSVPIHVPCTRSSALSCTLTSGATANRPLRGFGVLYLGLAHRFRGACSPCCTLRRKLPLVLPTFVRRRAVPRSPCLPTACSASAMLPDAHHMAIPPRRPSRLPVAGPGPSSFVVPSQVYCACGHFYLHERPDLQFLKTCGPGCVRHRKRVSAVVTLRVSGDPPCQRK